MFKTKRLKLSGCVLVVHIVVVLAFLDFASSQSSTSPYPTLMEKNDSTVTNVIKITGLRVENSENPVTYTDTNIPEFLEETKATVRLFGSGFTSDMTIAFGAATCEGYLGQTFTVFVDERSTHTALVEFIAPKASDSNYHLCLKNKDNIMNEQQNKDWTLIRSKAVVVPLWLTIILMIILLVLSALFSGLNLGLMALNKTEIKILCNTGSENERRYAKIIQPVRNHGNFLLCSILLGNVLVNSTNAMLMGGLTTGPIAIAASTILIVIFGEVSPQAICSRYGLAVGGNTIYLTKLVMLLTSPVAYPLSKVLDWILGEELGSVYNRERLKELVRLTTDGNLEKDEVDIISGALDMRKKTVAEVMTPIDDVFMLSYDAILDFDTVEEIMKSGYSRIPVYDGDRHNVQKILLIKDLALVDPNDNTPLRTLCEFYQNYCYFIFEDVTLAHVFKQFKTGQHGHLAFVRRINNQRDGDPYCETIGVITLEDVIEEMIQAEINDETDISADNRNKIKKLGQLESKQDFTAFKERRETPRIHISPQLGSAIFQYLSSYVDAFKAENISETMLRRLLNQDVIQHIKCKGKDKNDPSLVIYELGKPVDFFILILEGRVEVTAGQEKMTFECGPFTFFGSQTLTENVVGVESSQDIRRGSVQSINLDTYIKHSIAPDYSVKATKDLYYVAIKRNQYLAAKRATLMERSQKPDETGNNELDDEVKMYLSSLEDDSKHLEANMKKSTPATSKPTSPLRMIDEENDNGRNGIPVSVDQISHPLSEIKQNPSEQRE